MEKLERLLYVLNAVLIELEDYSLQEEGWCEDEIAAIRENLESIKDNVWRIQNEN